MRKYILITVLLVSLTAQAQETSVPQLPVKSITFASPELTSLGKYTLQPPNLWNGKPQQTINLLNIDEKEVSFSYDLFYNYSGFQPRDNEPGIGLGWGLTEGSIIKVVKHVDDDNPALLKRFSDFGNDLYTSEEIGPGVRGGSGGAALPGPGDSDFYDYSYTHNRLYYKLYDGQPDLYIYNFNGYSGKFILKGDNIINLEYNDLKITGSSSSGFYITTPDGIGYSFDLMDITFYLNRHTEANTCYYGGSTIITNYETSSNVGWKLTRIYNPNTQGYINFKYEPTGYTQVKSWFDPQSLVMVGKPKTESDNNRFNYTLWPDQSSSTVEYQTSRLKQIESNNRQITISYDNGTQPSEIKVYDKSNLSVPVKTVTFAHSYFGNSASFDTRWTKLESVRISGGQKNDLYKFNYVDEQFSSQDLTRETKSIDHWGYYNGKFNTTLYANQIRTRINQIVGTMNNIYDLSSIQWADRDPYIDFAKKFALEKVTFPTGGYTRYEYESSMGKGIRVNHMEENDGLASVHRYYNYGINPNLEASYFGREYFQYIWCPVIFGLQVDTHYVTFSVYPLGSFGEYVEDNIVYYNLVTELYGSPSGSGGKITYKFERADADPNPVLVEKKNFASGGEVLRTEEYDYNRIMLKQIDFWREPEMRSTGMATPSWKCNVGTQICQPVDVLDAYPYILGRFDCSVSSLYSYWSHLKSARITENGVTTTTGYRYRTSGLNNPPADCNIIGMIKTQSGGKNAKTGFKYPVDFKAEQPYSAMVGQNMLNPLVQKIDSIDNTQLLSSKLTFTKWNNLFYAPSQLIKTSGNSSWIEQVYHNYDIFTNPLHISKDGADQVVYIWGYNYLYPIAEIRNATYAQVTAIINEATLSAIASKNEPAISDWTLISNLRQNTSLPNALVTTYTYQPLVGISTATDPSGITTYYDYDTFGRLKETYIYKDNIVSPANKQIVQKYEYNYKTQ